MWKYVASKCARYSLPSRAVTFDICCCCCPIPCAILIRFINSIVVVVVLLLLLLLRRRLNKKMCSSFTQALKAHERNSCAICVCVFRSLARSRTASSTVAVHSLCKQRRRRTIENE
jgi:nucleoside permease NupC